MQLLKNCIGPTIRIGRESWCLPYAGFFPCLVIVSFKIATSSLRLSKLSSAQEIFQIQAGLRLGSALDLEFKPGLSSALNENLNLSQAQARLGIKN